MNGQTLRSNRLKALTYALIQKVLIKEAREIDRPLAMARFAVIVVKQRG